MEKIFMAKKKKILILTVVDGRQFLFNSLLFSLFLPSPSPLPLLEIEIGFP